ncbi:MAG TPA: hypothetical protein VFU46_11955 [Gemmatimonadales bacterium]|nr:hypothetical protein [Gemmatimonadales bacterium]
MLDDERLRDEERLRLDERLRGELLPRLAGTLAPFFRASESPIAIACLRLFTLPPLPPRPLRSVPRFRRRIALSTLLLAFGPYLRPLDFFDRFVAMPGSRFGSIER